MTTPAKPIKGGNPTGPVVDQPTIATEAARAEELARLRKDRAEAKRAAREQEGTE